MSKEEKLIIVFCDQCGSQDIDAWTEDTLRWNIKTQQWEWDNGYGDNIFSIERTHCIDCDSYSHGEIYLSKRYLDLDEDSFKEIVERNIKEEMENK